MYHIDTMYCLTRRSRLYVLSRSASSAIAYFNARPHPKIIRGRAYYSAHIPIDIMYCLTRRARLYALLSSARSADTHLNIQIHTIIKNSPSSAKYPRSARSANYIIHIFNCSRLKCCMFSHIFNNTYTSTGKKKPNLT